MIHIPFLNGLSKHISRANEIIALTDLITNTSLPRAIKHLDELIQEFVPREAAISKCARHVKLTPYLFTNFFPA
jgi:hypothetical protein